MYKELHPKSTPHPIRWRSRQGKLISSSAVHDKHVHCCFRMKVAHHWCASYLPIPLCNHQRVSLHCSDVFASTPISFVLTIDFMISNQKRRLLVWKTELRVCFWILEQLTKPPWFPFLQSFTLWAAFVSSDWKDQRKQIMFSIVNPNLFSSLFGSTSWYFVPKWTI